MPDFTPIETQEALDKLLNERETAVRGEYADYENLREQVEQQTATIRSYEHADLRRKIAGELGISDALACRIAGEDEESMRADAQALLDALPKEKKRKAPPLRDPEAHDPTNSPWSGFISRMKGD